MGTLRFKGKTCDYSEKHPGFHTMPELGKMPLIHRSRHTFSYVINSYISPYILRKMPFSPNKTEGIP